MVRAIKGKKGRGCPKFLDRERDLKRCLEEDGSLVFEVDIQMTVATKSGYIWYPKKLERQDILVDLYQDASSETSDVAFSVGGGAVYRVHKNILSSRCKGLYEISKDWGVKDTPIAIDSNTDDVFKRLLDFVYTVKTPKIENQEVAMELLIAADRYDCVPLKLYVESILVDKFLTAASAAELLIFADSYSCALLKEAATNLFLQDPQTVKKAGAWSKIKESNRLLEELLDSSIKPVEKNDDGGGNNEMDCFDVATLRDKLLDAGLPLDGSYEALKDRLKTHHQENATEEQ